MCKRNKVCIYMFIVVMVLQIIIPALSVILETSYTLTSEAADNITATWNIGAEGSRVTAKFYASSGKLIIEGKGKIKDYPMWTYGLKDYKNEFKSIEICEGVTDIGIKAFHACYYLKNVDAKYVKNIRESAFEGCTRLETITMNNVKNIDIKAFYNCQKLTVCIPHTITKIGEKAFYDVFKVKGDIDMPNRGAMLILGNNLTEVGEHAFKYVKNMQGDGVVLTSGADTKNIYKNIENTFPKNTSLYICNEAYEQISSNNYFRYRIRSISLTEPTPTKELYVNEPLNLNDYYGLKVEFTNGTELVTYFKKGIFACNYKNGTLFSSTGKKTVKIQLGKTINEKERLVKYEITVKNKPIEIQKIQINNPPDKIEYMVGETLNTKGLKVVGIDTYGTEILLDKDQYTCSPTSFATPGTKTITVRYKENPNLKATFQITVKPRYTAEIISYPNKMTYKVNERLDLKGLEVKVTYPKTNLISEVFTLDDIDANPKNGTKLTKVGTKTIKMTSKDGLDLGSFNVTVTKETRKVESIKVKKKHTKKKKLYRR